MKYRYLFAAGVLCLGLAALLEWLHLGEENSLLVFGPAFMGLAAIFSPLVLGAAKAPEEVGFRPSGRAVLQSLLFPLLGVAMLVWGLLGETGVVPRFSFDGPRQHCRRCGVTWVLKGEREGRQHYIEGCSYCLDFPEVRQIVDAMFLELCAQQPEPQDGQSPEAFEDSIKLCNRSPVGVDVGSTLLFDRNTPNRKLQTAFQAPLEFVLQIDGQRVRPEQPGLTYNLELRFTISERATGVARFIAQRTGEFTGIPKTIQH